MNSTNKYNLIAPAFLLDSWIAMKYIKTILLIVFWMMRILQGSVLKSSKLTKIWFSVELSQKNTNLLYFTHQSYKDFYNVTFFYFVSSRSEVDRIKPVFQSTGLYLTLKCVLGSTKITNLWSKSVYVNLRSFTCNNRKTQPISHSRYSATWQGD